MSSSPPIVVAAEEHARLLQLAESARGTQVAELLEVELERAKVLPLAQVPVDVVVMNSEVEYEDLALLSRRRVQLVYPHHADASDGRVSVLAPLGCAILGLRVGQAIDWRMPGGPSRIRVLSVNRVPPPRDA